MAQDNYTHDFKFEVNGNFLRGSCEFNDDGESSFKIEQVSDPLQDKTLDWFSELMDLLKTIHDSEKAGTEIKNISIIKKEA